MKKIFATILTLFYFSVNSSLAFSELYYLKDTTVDNVKPIVESGYSNRNYKILKTNPYYGISQKDSSDFAVVILQQSGKNMFYFYKSNGYKKINKDILKSLDKKYVTYEQSYNTNIINIYEELAVKAMSNQTNNYVFTDNTTPSVYTVKSSNSSQNQIASSQNTQIQPKPNTLNGYVAQVASGTKFGAYLQNSINTSSASVGDDVIAVLTSNVNYNGTVVFPQGSMVYGKLKKARHATYGSRNGRVVIEFYKIITPDNKGYDIKAEEVDFTVSNDGKVASVAGNVAVGALVGSLAGLLFGAFNGHMGSSVAVGAGVGAGSALIGGAAERGVDAEIPSFTEIEITLTSPVNVTVNY